MSAPRKLAINRLRERRPLDAAAVDRFLSRHEVPIVEGSTCTFVFRGEVDEVWVTQRVVGLPDRIPMRRLRGTDLWWVTIELPEGSRVEYQIEIREGERYERFNDPRSPHQSHSPMGGSSVCFAAGYETPPWSLPDPQARPGELVDMSMHSKALRRDVRVQVYLPARFRRTATYPLLVVHDGSEFMQYSAAKTVLDNLIHSLDVAETVVAFVDPGDRLVEYADSAAHARFVNTELLPRLEQELPLVDRRSGRALLGASFGAIAAFSTASRARDTWGSLVLLSGSFVFTDIGFEHGGGPVFDPVVEFVNRYRARPRHVADRIFMSCGVYEQLIVPNRSMVRVFEQAGMEVRYTEARDGHSWENWRDRLRDALSYVYPGPQRFVYE